MGWVVLSLAWEGDVAACCGAGRMGGVEGVRVGVVIPVIGFWMGVGKSAWKMWRVCIREERTDWRDRQVRRSRCSRADVLHRNAHVEEKCRMLRQ